MYKVLVVRVSILNPEVPLKRSDHLILDSLSQITVSRVKWLQIKVTFPPGFQKLVFKSRSNFDVKNNHQVECFTCSPAPPSQVQRQSSAF